jgi:hypothetical protein
LIAVQPFHDLGHIVEKQAGNDRRCRRDQQGKSERQTDAGDDCGNQPEPACPGRQARQQRVDPRHCEIVEDFPDAEPQRDQRKNGQAQRLEKHRAEFGREKLACGGACSLEDHRMGFPVRP